MLLMGPSLRYSHSLGSRGYYSVRQRSNRRRATPDPPAYSPHPFPGGHMSDDLRKVMDELEIRNVIGRLAQLADNGDLNEYVSLFTDDAHWELKPRPGDAPLFAPIRGKANILAGAQARRASGGQGPGSHTRHVLGSTVVSLDGDDR